MGVIAETDVKKDSRNRVVLPVVAGFTGFEIYHVKTFDDGHIELYPRVLADPTISLHTLAMMDSAMANFAEGHVSDPVDADALLAALGED